MIKPTAIQRESLKMKEKLTLKDIIFFSIIFLMVIACVAGKLYADHQDKKETERINAERIVGIHIKGEIKESGYYELPYGSRVKDAVEKAGGITENADIDGVNLAEKLTDGEELIIPKVMTEKERAQSAKININMATKAVLTTLPGIGNQTAEKIIKYREEKGRFRKIEELKNIDGITASKFETIKNDISVE